LPARFRKWLSDDTSDLLWFFTEQEVKEKRRKYRTAIEDARALYGHWLRQSKSDLRKRRVPESTVFTVVYNWDTNMLSVKCDYHTPLEEFLQSDLH
jgi:hypothetical protein